MSNSAPPDPVVLGLDLGTTTCKAVAVDATGRAVASAEHPYRLHAPQPGWVEQEPEAIWQGTVAVLSNLAAQLGDSDIRALAMSSAMHTLLPVDGSGAPLARAMSWGDSRAQPQVQALREQVDAHALYQRTGCPLRTTYHPARLRWYAENEPAIWAQAARWVSLKAWVLHHLAGVWANDESYASTTGLLDIHERAWEGEALALAGVSAAQLPALAATDEIVGQVTERAASVCGLRAGVPVVAGGNDGGLAQVGAGAAEEEDGSAFVITVGTSGAIRRVVAEPLLDPQERTWCYVLDESRWFAGGAINNGGLVSNWMWDRLFAEVEGEIEYARIMEEASKAPPGAAGLLALPYLTGERSPHWDPALTATLHGLTLGHTRPHIVRALLEGVAFCLADVWDALCPDERPSEPLKLTGGITHDRLWAQIVADVLGVPLLPMDVADASAVGAALVGWQALGQTVTPAELEQGAEDVLTPDGARHELYEEKLGAWRELYERLYRRSASSTSEG